MNTKRVGVIAVILVAAVLFVFFIRSIQKENPQTSDTNSVTVNEVSINESSASINFEMTGTYPQIQGLSNQETQTALNKQIKTLVDEQISLFSSDLEAAQQNERLPETIASQAGQFSVTPTVAQASDDIVSVQLQFMSSVPGMAHPANYNKTVTYDVKLNKSLQLEDLFVENSDYINELSNLAKQNLEQKNAQDSNAPMIFDEGLTPEAGNFELFTLGENSLNLIFNPATVMPDYAGTQTVSIPLSELTQILKPEYQ